MNATEIRFWVPLRTGGHTTVILELFPAMGDALKPHARSRIDGDETTPTCTVQNLHDAVVCVRGFMDRVVEFHGRLDYSGPGREEALHAAALVLWLAMQTVPGTRTTDTK